MQILNIKRKNEIISIYIRLFLIEAPTLFP